MTTRSTAILISGLLGAPLFAACGGDMTAMEYTPLTCDITAVNSKVCVAPTDYSPRLKMTMFVLVPSLCPCHLRPVGLVLWCILHDGARQVTHACRKDTDLRS